MIRIAIVEDDDAYATTLEKYIHRYEEEVGEKFLIKRFQDGEDIAIEYRAEFDVILMDIEMQFMDGMTTAENIRKVDEEVVIIFITNMPQFAMQGYKVDALDYVLKPINYFAFSQRIERALSRMQKRRTKFISVNYKGGIQKINVADILYIEIQNHDLIYHTKTGQIVVRGTMRELEEKLKDEPFYRCNKAFLINLEHVNGFEDNDVLIDGERVQVSRAKKKEFMDVLNDYMNEVSK